MQDDRRAVLVPGSQHCTGHDRPQPGTDGGSRRRLWISSNWFWPSWPPSIAAKRLSKTMKGASLRHQPPRAPSRKPVPRGASRMVAKEPMSVRLPKANFGFLKALFWPVLLVALGFGTYEGAQRLLPYADRPITKISVQGDFELHQPASGAAADRPVRGVELLHHRPGEHAHRAGTNAMDRPRRSASGVAGSGGDPPGRTTAGGPLGR